MDLKLVVSMLSILMYFSSTHATRSRELLTVCNLDVTNVKYGVKFNSDITKVTK